MIEGERKDVHEVFAKICRDPRDHEVTPLFQEEIPRRDFADWTMAFHELDQADAEAQEGFNDVLNSRNNQTVVDAYAPKVRAFLRLSSTSAETPGS